MGLAHLGVACSQMLGAVAPAILWLLQGVTCFRINHHPLQHIPYSSKTYSESYKICWGTPGRKGGGSQADCWGQLHLGLASLTPPITCSSHPIADEESVSPQDSPPSHLRLSLALLTGIGLPERADTISKTLIWAALADSRPSVGGNLMSLLRGCGSQLCCNLPENFQIGRTSGKDGR